MAGAEHALVIVGIVGLAGVAASCGDATTSTIPRGEGAIVRRTAPCVGDPACRVVSRTNAGDRAHRAAVIVETSLGLRSAETGAPATEDEPFTCELREFWLEYAGTWELVLALCNDGYGASGIGEDDVTVRDGTLIHGQVGGSAWRWSTEHPIAFFPRRILRSRDYGYWAIGPNVEDRDFDFEQFTGSVQWFSPACGEELSGDGDAIGEMPAGRERTYRALPIVEVDPDLDLARVDVRACATRVDGSGDAGFLLDGVSGGARDAEVDVLIAGTRTVIVVVHDDAIVAGDVLTVHHGASTPTYYEHCLDPAATFASVAFDLADGGIEGDATAIAARLGQVAGGRTLRFELPYDDAQGGLTITYSDADTPGVVERSFATSDFHAGDAWSLGARTHVIGTTRCEVREGALVRVHRDEPVRPLFER